MLQYQCTQTPFSMGLQEGVDPRQTPPGTLVTAENVVWQQHGRIQKRSGVSLFTKNTVGVGALSNPRRVWARGGELCCLDDNGVNAYSATNAIWRNVGKVPAVGLTWTTLLDSTGGVQSFDTSVGSTGMRVDAWVTGGLGSTGSLFVQVVDSATQAIIITPTRLSTTCLGVRVLSVGASVVVVAQTSTTSLSAMVVTFSIAGPTFGLLTTLRTDNTARSWDACTVGANFAIAYNSSSTVFSLYTYDTLLNQQATGTMTESVGVRGVSLDSNGTVLYVAYIQSAAANPAVRFAVFTSALVQSVSPVTIETPAGATTAGRIGCCVYDSTHAVVAYDMPDTSVGPIRLTSYLVSSAGVVTTTSKRGCFYTTLSARPFMLGGKCYQLAVDSSNVGVDTSDTVLFEIEVSDSSSVTGFVPQRLVGVIDLLIGGVPNTSLTSPLPSFGTLSASSLVFLSPFLSAVNGVFGNQPSVRQGLRLVTIAPASGDMQRPLSNNNESYLSGPVYTAYDGAIAFDYGFTRAPVFGATGSTTGGTIAAGTYLYGGYLEFRSATGLVYRSPTNTSPPAVVLTGATGSVAVGFNSFSTSTRQSIANGFGTSAIEPTLGAIYRSTAGSPVYQRLTVEPAYNAPYISQNVSFAGITDTSPDNSISGTLIPLSTRPALYTTGGILDDYAPPASITQFLHVDRLWLLAGDARSWWYSKAFQDDLGTAPGFHPQFRVTFSEPQVAGASMDDKAIFFSLTGIAYMQGLGPAPNGQNSDFGAPTKIQTDVGCINARSVVSTPDGIMFLSARGIYLLSRGLEVTWIGRPVQLTLAQYPVITSAVLVPNANQVRFTCNAVNGATGVVIVYDYVEKQWSTWRVNVFGLASAPFADACMWRGGWVGAANGWVVYEDATTYLDSGTYVSITLETAWMSASGPLLFYAVRALELHGQNMTDHDLTVSFGFDSDPSYPQTVTFTGTTPVVAVGPLETEISVGTRRKCSTIRLKIQDTAPSAGTVGTGQGMQLDMMGLQVGQKQGFGNTPATRRG